MKPSLTRILSLTAVVTVALGLGACETIKPGKRSAFDFDPPLTQPSNPANVKLKLSTSAQVLYVVEGDKVLLATPVCVGTRKDPTPHGNFTIYHKDFDRRRISSPGAGYPMTYWMEFKTAYGFHWGFVKPYPATHGCVRMPMDSARKVFSVVRIGTPVNISTTQPWDATIGKSLPVLDDGPLADPPETYLKSSQVWADAPKGKLWKYD